MGNNKGHDVAVTLSTLFFHLGEHISNDLATIILGDVPPIILGNVEELRQERSSFYLIILRETKEDASVQCKEIVNRCLSKETELINEIVTEIHHKLGVSLSNTPPPLIGMYRDIRFITSWLTDGSSHTADILTIWGMGGTGKTSLAEHLFRLHSHEFQRSSFIADISRKCAEKSGGLLDLQNQICHDISKTSSIQVHNVSAYTSQIENAIARRKLTGLGSIYEQFRSLCGLLELPILENRQKNDYHGNRNCGVLILN
ncbi:hypothetical protein L6452_30023 [Arctium lappa]|uniref:Uncharacterized protein n=1 Tax=Arctium lappa TaxID=4217 RepID=A0ACB8ZHQ7_ARCLA|nr:hypothetical protein L6452_30023 [Arctium lappa]